jgi:hypothetical protein
MTLLQQAQELAPHIAVKLLPIEQIERNAHQTFKAINGREAKGLNDAGIVVNYIRHKLSAYDKLMDTTRKHKNGAHEREILAAATLMAIAQNYAHVPRLVAECQRQLEKKTQEPKIRVWRAD